jgi:FAD/FMN-containing dehydrogenase
MGSTSFVAEAAASLAAGFKGQVLESGDADYEEARKVHNGLVDKRPALIAQCNAVTDVIAALGAARKLGLEFSVRGGGHNVAGRATVDGGVMIDLSPMNGVVVDPKAKTVRAQGGATWAHLNAATQPHSLAVTGGVVSATGVGGLTLGGGLGWLMGKYGLALDNLRSIELVTADGKVLQVSAQSEPDLFWALRGGGGNFGIATSFEFDLHAVGPNVVAGPIVHPIERAGDTLKFFREATQSLADEQILFAGLTHAPDGSGAPVAALVTCHCGAPAEAERAVQPLRQFGAPLVDGVGSIPYDQLNATLDGSFPKGAFNYWKSSFLAELSDAAIETIVDCFTRCPTAMSQFLIEHLHGAVTRVGVSETAFPHRKEGYNFLILAQWTDPAETNACIEWARETARRMRPFFAAGRYVNYLDDDETGDPIAAAYGPNYRRLQQIKARYDPANVFRMNQNIRPLA